MSNKKLQESEYEGYFNSLSKGMKDGVAEIEVMAVSIMDRELTDWIPFFGISYDPSEKTISIISNTCFIHLFLFCHIFSTSAWVQNSKLYS